MTIYLIRHGETDWNRDRRYQGQRDIPLNETGRAQARRNGEALRALLPEIAQADFISSPLGRARETMEIVRAALSLPPERYAIDDRVKELNYGHWEGMLQDELPLIDPRGLAQRSLDPLRWRPDAGESYADLLVRVAEWANTITRDSVVTAHGGVSRCLRAHALGLDPSLIPALESPQDRVLVISKGHMEWL